MTEEVRQYYIFLGQVGLGGVDSVLFLLDHDMLRVSSSKGSLFSPRIVILEKKYKTGKKNSSITLSRDHAPEK